MSRLRSIVVAIAAMCVLAPAATADAAVNCAGLQSALTGSASGGVIVLNELCTGSQFTLPSHPITLEGQAGTGAGFDGTGAPGRMLSGSNVGATRIANLIFQDGVGGANLPGGAVQITGASTPTFDSVQFYNNRVSGLAAGGGAVAISSSATGATPVVISNSTFGETGRGNLTSNGPGAGMQVQTSGAPIQVTNSRFAANQSNSTGGGLFGVAGAGQMSVSNSVFEGNTAAVSSGGAFLVGNGGTLSGNRFSSNHVSNPSITGPSGFAGGVSFVSCCAAPGPTLTSTGNVIDSNTVNFVATGDTEANSGGARFQGVTLDSHNDRVVNNTLQGPSGTGESEGSGLFIESCASAGGTPNRATQLVVAGNQIGPGAEAKGGLYVGCSTGNAHLQLLDSTVSGNTGGAGSSPGLWGDVSNDQLDLVNTIVAGNTGGPDITGFQSVTASFSDACVNGAAIAGTGNICADPKLVAAGPGSADIHQTAASPTIDAGSNGLIPAGLTTDYEGKTRIVDFRGKGPIVDIGAEEATAPAKDTTASVLSAFKVKPSTFSALSKGASIITRAKKKRKRGARVSYSLSEAASVSFTVARKVKGRRKGRKCVTKRKRGKRCTKFKSVKGSFVHSGKQGSNSFKFSGRVAGRKLRPGSYRMTGIPTDAAANKGKPVTANFKIVR